MQILKEFVNPSQVFQVSILQIICIVALSAAFSKLISTCHMSNIDVNQDRPTVIIFTLPCIHLYAFCMCPDCFAGDFAVRGLELTGLSQSGCGESP